MYSLWTAIKKVTLPSLPESCNTRGIESGMLQIAQQAPSLWRETTLYNLRRRRFFDTCVLFGSGQSAMALIATQWTWIRTQADTFTINYSVHLPLIPTYHIQEDAGGRTPDLWERQWMAERLAPKREMLSETVW